MKIPYQDEGEYISIVWGKNIYKYKKILEVWNKGERYLAYTNEQEDSEGSVQIFVSQSLEIQKGKRFLMEVEPKKWQHIQRLFSL